MEDGVERIDEASFWWCLKLNVPELWSTPDRAEVAFGEASRRRLGGLGSSLGS